MRSAVEGINSVPHALMSHLRSAYRNLCLQRRRDLAVPARVADNEPLAGGLPHSTWRKVGRLLPIPAAQNSRRSTLASSTHARSWRLSIGTLLGGTYGRWNLAPSRFHGCAHAPCTVLAFAPILSAEPCWAQWHNLRPAPPQFRQLPAARRRFQPVAEDRQVDNRHAVTPNNLAATHAATAIGCYWRAVGGRGAWRGFTMAKHRETSMYGARGHARCGLLSSGRGAAAEAGRRSDSASAIISRAVTERWKS